MAKSKKKQNIFLNLPKATLQFVKEAKDELKKVTWPNRQTTIRYTAIIVVASLAVGLVIGGVDYLFTLALQQIV